MEPIYQVLLTTLTSFGICFFAIPSIIKVAEIKNLFDEPCDRKRHAENVPTLGGIAIFAGFIFSITFWANQNQIIEMQYIIASLIILFFMGIKDDIVNLVAHKKLLGQILAASILVFYADIRLTSLFGLFGLFQIPYWASCSLSLVAIIGITNSFNLIDGIDTLAGSIGSLASLVFGTWFFLAGNYQYAVASFSMLGALMAFLYYNKTPSSIFMGDTGSLVLGLVCSILAIKFVEYNRAYIGPEQFQVLSAPAVALSILIIPIFDTLRVFFLRILQGKSPLSSDRNHIHHILTDIGFSHIHSTFILIGTNIFLSFGTFYLMHLKGELLLTLNLFCMLLFSVYFTAKRRKKNRFKILKNIAS